MCVQIHLHLLVQDPAVSKLRGRVLSFQFGTISPHLCHFHLSSGHLVFLSICSFESSVKASFLTGRSLWLHVGHFCQNIELNVEKDEQNNGEKLSHNSAVQDKSDI